jgi:hypothetical protein
MARSRVVSHKMVPNSDLVAVMSKVRIGYKNKAKTNPKYNFKARTGYGTG